MQTLFNWFYWAINLGALASIMITTNVEKYVSYWLAFLIPLIVFFGSIIALIVGRQRYIRNPPNGSLIIRAFRIIKLAIQMRWKLGKLDDKKHILDYAKEIELPNENTNEKEIELPNENTNGKEGIKQNTNQFIDDLKQAIHVCRVFAFYPFYWICYNQLVGNLTSQAAQMDVGKMFYQIIKILFHFKYFI